jgi:phage terminase large subunit
VAPEPAVETLRPSLVGALITLEATAGTIPELEFGKVPAVWVQQGNKLHVIYALQPKQWEAFRATPLGHPEPRKAAKHIGYGGAAGAGKSHLARAVASAAAFRWPGSTSIIFRRTFDELRENHIVKFLQEVPDFGGQLYKFNKQERTVEWFNGSRTLFGYLRHEDDVFKYQGPEYDLEIFEEATHYSWNQVSYLSRSRLRGTVRGARPFVLYPTNPGNRGHAWYKRLFITRDYREKERPQDYTFIQARVWDNFELLYRDPEYVDGLDALPEPLRSQLLEGDFTAGTGMALEELSWDQHLVPAFEPPPHWLWFAAFDWGFSHPWTFSAYAIDEYGHVYCVDSITGRHQRPDEIAERIREKFDPNRFSYIVGGRDIFAEHKARGESVRAISEQMGDYGFYFTPANVARVHGLNALREWIAWRGRGPAIPGQFDRNGRPVREDGLPGLRFMDTRINRVAFDQLTNITLNPDDPEDALKVDADEMGQNGDDFYDQIRYAMASRPPRPAHPIKQEQAHAWDKDVLENEARELRTVRHAPVPDGFRVGVGNPDLIHSEFGEML